MRASQYRYILLIEIGENVNPSVIPYICNKYYCIVYTLGRQVCIKHNNVLHNLYYNKQYNIALMLYNMESLELL